MTTLTKVEGEVLTLIYKGKYYKAKFGWQYDVENELSQSNINKVVRVYHKGFGGAWYVLFCSDKVLVVKHKTNDMNTEFMINHLDRKLPNKIDVEASELK